MFGLLVTEFVPSQKKRRKRGHYSKVFTRSFPTIPVRCSGGFWVGKRGSKNPILVVGYENNYSAGDFEVGSVGLRSVLFFSSRLTFRVRLTRREYFSKGSLGWVLEVGMEQPSRHSVLVGIDVPSDPLDSKIDSCDGSTYVKVKTITIPDSTKGRFKYAI